MSEIVLTSLEKQIYNTYLAAIGKANDRPFRPRKNFDKLDDEKCIELRRLSAFFKQHELDLQDFFDAPFQLHKDDKFQPLSYYNSQNAINAYTRFKKQMEAAVSPEQLLYYCKKGLTFLLKYCIEHKLTIEQYRNHNTESGIPLCMLHIKEHKINFFIVHALEIREQIYKLEREWREFYVRDFDEIFRATYKTYCYSPEIKRETEGILQLIEKKLKI